MQYNLMRQSRQSWGNYFQQKLQNFLIQSEIGKEMVDYSPRCPKCNSPYLAGAVLCPLCGIVFAKLTARQEQTSLREGSKEVLAPIEAFDAIPAGFWIRALARSIDTYFVATVVLLMKQESLFIFFLFDLIYHSYFLVSPWHATPGKKILGLKVVSETGEQVSQVMAASRFLASQLSYLIFGIGYLMAAFNPKKLALHDKLVGTCVVAAKQYSFLEMGAGWVLWAIAILKIYGPIYEHQIASRKIASSQRVSLATVSGPLADTCVDKKYCVMVYISPWCSHCQSSVPFIQEVRDYLKTSPNVGFKIVVGHDKPERVKEMAERIQGDVFLDADASYYNSLGINSVPRWISWDEKKAVVAEIKGAVHGATPQVFLEQHLKVHP